MAEHSPIGPSTLERVFNCPGSVNLIAKLDREAPASEYAAEGTVAHTLASDYLSNPKWKGVPLEKRLGEIHEQDGFKITVSQDMIDAVQIYLDWVDAFIEEYGLEPDDIFIERKLAIPHIGFGTVDFGAHVAFDRIVVNDYKHGAGKRVSPVGNKQTLAYALGIYHAVPANLRDQVSRVDLTITQPRCPGGGVNRYYIHIDALKKFDGELANAIARTKPANAPLIPGDWCDNTFCPARTSCPALRQHVQKSVDAKFAEVVLDSDHFPAPQTLTNDELEMIMDNEPAVSGFMKACKDEAYARVRAGQEFSRYKEVDKRANRTFIDEAEAGKALIALGLTMKDITIHKLKSPKQIEDLIKATNKTLKAEGKDVIKFDLAKSVQQISSGTTLVRIDDERPVKADPFKDVIEVGVI